MAANASSSSSSSSSRPIDPPENDTRSMDLEFIRTSRTGRHETWACQAEMLDLPPLVLFSPSEHHEEAPPPKRQKRKRAGKKVRERRRAAQVHREERRSKNSAAHQQQQQQRDTPMEVEAPPTTSTPASTRLRSVVTTPTPTSGRTNATPARSPRPSAPILRLDPIVMSPVRHPAPPPPRKKAARPHHQQPQQHVSFTLPEEGPAPTVQRQRRNRKRRPEGYGQPQQQQQPQPHPTATSSTPAPSNWADIAPPPAEPLPPNPQTPPRYRHRRLQRATLPDTRQQQQHASSSSYTPPQPLMQIEAVNVRRIITTSTTRRTTTSSSDRRSRSPSPPPRPTSNNNTNFGRPASPASKARHAAAAAAAPPPDARAYSPPPPFSRPGERDFDRWWNRKTDVQQEAFLAKAEERKEKHARKREEDEREERKRKEMREERLALIAELSYDLGGDDGLTNVERRNKNENEERNREHLRKEVANLASGFRRMRSAGIHRENISPPRIPPLPADYIPNVTRRHFPQVPEGAEARYSRQYEAGPQYVARDYRGGSTITFRD